MSDMGGIVQSHKFKPLRWWDRWRKVAECRKCYWAKGSHPMKSSVLVRCEANDD